MLYDEESFETEKDDTMFSVFSSYFIFLPFCFLNCSVNDSLYTTAPTVASAATAIATTITTTATEATTSALTLETTSETTGATTATTPTTATTAGATTIFTTTTTTESTNYIPCVTSCQNEMGQNLPLGTYANCSDCESYIICNDGFLTPRQCETGTNYYARTLGVCTVDKSVW